MSENWKENLEEIKRQKSLGRIRHYGVCNFGPQNLKDMLDADFQAVTNQVHSNAIQKYALCLPSLVLYHKLFSECFVILYIMLFQ